MSDTATALPKDHRMVIAWNAFQSTDEFRNALKWSLATIYDDNRPISPMFKSEHVKGALWLAFTKGMEVTETIDESFADKFHDANQRIAALVAELAASKAEVERLKDLVRYSRAALHEDGLITNKEYADLVQIDGSVARLEGYDEVQARLAELSAVWRDARSRGMVRSDLFGEPALVARGDNAAL